MVGVRLKGGILGSALRYLENFPFYDNDTHE